jgi:hypothetical protein
MLATLSILGRLSTSQFRELNATAGATGWFAWSKPRGPDGTAMTGHAHRLVVGQGNSYKDLPPSCVHFAPP